MLNSHENCGEQRQTSEILRATNYTLVAETNGLLILLKYDDDLTFFNCSLGPQSTALELIFYSMKEEQK